jgi:NAD(P)-dependent dehydrogenase (short-subunit alcohol dehydrogenase family)
MFRLDNKVAIVTGSTSGIGRAIADVLTPLTDGAPLRRVVDGGTLITDGS